MLGFGGATPATNGDPSVAPLTPEEHACVAADATQTVDRIAPYENEFRVERPDGVER